MGRSLPPSASRPSSCLRSPSKDRLGALEHVVSCHVVVVDNLVYCSIAHPNEALFVHQNLSVVYRRYWIDNQYANMVPDPLAR